MSGRAPAVSRLSRRSAEVLGTSHWLAWPAELRHPESPDVAAFARQHQRTVAFHAFCRASPTASLPPRPRRRPTRVVAGLLPGPRRRSRARRGGGLVGAGHADARCFRRRAARSVLRPWSGLVLAAAGPGRHAQRWLRRVQRPAGRQYAPCRGAADRPRHGPAPPVRHPRWRRRLSTAPTSPIQWRTCSAQVALQSQRAKCLVVGEDLGTVPEGMSEALAASNILSYRVLVVRTPKRPYPSAGRMAPAGRRLRLHP